MKSACVIHDLHIYDILLGGEGESEEDEEDEPVTELKKPNSDEVRAVTKLR